MSGWLGYQIEHHLIPDLPMRQYCLIQPRVKALCLAHGVPYRQESVFRRFGRLLDVCVGKTTMRQLEAFPAAAEAVPGPYSPSSRWEECGSDILLETTAEGRGDPQGAAGSA
jgi:hypothetical protein